MRIEKTLLIFIILLLALTGAAQTKRKAKSGLPRVGTIKNYEATGLAAGCNNLYFTFPKRVETTGENYVFISRPEGADAWMNLDGRDAALEQIGFSKQKKVPFRFYYRAGKVLIDVLIEDFKPRDAPYEEGDSMFKMRIRLRTGRAVKTIRAVGDADC